MKQILTRVSALAFMLIIVVKLAATTGFAAETSITYTGVLNRFSLDAGNQYTATDLFDSFKGVMPGDRLTQTIRIRNEATDSDYIKLYMRALLHDEQNNPLSQKVAEKGENVEWMHDFLSKLYMRIYHESNLIYEGAPDKTDGLSEKIYLGRVQSGQSSVLSVELDIPVELDNVYADRMGEVDWVFTVEAFNLPSEPTADETMHTVRKVWEDGGAQDRPASVQVCLLCDGDAYEWIELSEENHWTYTWSRLDEAHRWSIEESVPEGYTARYSVYGTTTVITNHKESGPDVPDVPDIPDAPAEPVSITVRKVWAGDETAQKNRPQTAEITLYKGKEPVESVLLGAHNDWSYTWGNLEPGAEWGVLEAKIPRGYVPSYQAQGSVITVTNTATLIQTGQMKWPIPVLGLLGFGLVVAGAYLMRGKKNRHE